MGVSNNRGTPKWMVKIMENLIKIDDLGGNPPKPAIYGLVITPKNEASIGSHGFFVVTNDGES